MSRINRMYNVTREYFSTPVIPAIQMPNICQQRKRKVELIMYWYRWFVLIVASIAFMAVFERHIWPAIGLVHI